MAEISILLRYIPDVDVEAEERTVENKTNKETVGISTRLSTQYQ